MGTEKSALRTSSGKISDSDEKVGLEVELFRPSDLSLNMADISEKMNGFRFIATVSDDLCSEDQNKEVSGNLVKSGELKLKIKRNCSYRVSLSYGFSDDLAADNPTLSEVYYRTEPALEVSGDYLMQHDPVEIKLLLKLTEAGRDLGLVVEEIQGKNYERGKKIPVIKKTASESHSSLETSPGPAKDPAQPAESEKEVPAYSSDIEALLSEGVGNCVSCHSETGGILPDLTGRDKAVQYADRILARTKEGTMPTEASIEDGKTRKLTGDEIKLIEGWIDGGKP